MKLSHLTALLLIGNASLSAADFRLASAISDHMVLQRDKPVSIWSWADAGETVAVAPCGAIEVHHGGHGWQMDS